MERVILHCDANSYYASVECLYTPAIRDKPVAVCGDPEARHGIVLTKNPIAKSFGVQTGDPIWKALQKCPKLVCVKPDYPLYIRFSNRMRRIFEQYSDRVESFGLDECWLDVSNPGFTIEDGARVADEIRNRIREELGITVSVGVASNKIFAKLGSDLKKPDATTVIPARGFESVIWQLPAQELLYVGPATRRKLNDIGVFTIGDLARCDNAILYHRLGKNGLILKRYAAGEDRSPVMPVDFRASIKSVGNSTTPPHDLTCIDDARCIYYLLAESVAARLRKGGFCARRISISARNTSLITHSAQLTLPRPTNLTDDIASAALSLFDERFARDFPYRSVGLSCSMLSPDNAPVQLDFMGDESHRMRIETLERTIDGLRYRFGHQIIQRGVVLADKDYAAVNPIDDNTVHPVPFYAG